MLSLDAQAAEDVDSFLEYLPADGPDPQTLVERSELQEVVRQAIGKLPADQARALSLRFLADLSIREIAHALDRSEGAVKSLLHRALEGMRQQLKASWPPRARKRWPRRPAIRKEREPMSRKSSTFVKQTRDRETWLPSAVGGESADPKELTQLLATAALTRGVLEAIPVPEEGEERSRAQCVAVLQEISLNRSRSTEVAGALVPAAGALHALRVYAGTEAVSLPPIAIVVGINFRPAGRVYSFDPARPGAGSRDPPSLRRRRGGSSSATSSTAPGRSPRTRWCRR